MMSEADLVRCNLSKTCLILCPLDESLIPRTQFTEERQASFHPWATVGNHAHIRHTENLRETISTGQTDWFITHYRHDVRRTSRELSIENRNPFRLNRRTL